MSTAAGPRRRRLLAALAGAVLPVAAGRAAASTTDAATTPAAAAPGTGVRRGHTLAFPRDHGAHPDTRTEWWYATGWLGTESTPTHGFQVTFFRSRTDLAATSRSRFAARQILFAHAAVTELGARRHRHASVIARWNGDPRARPDFAALDDASLAIGRWSLRRDAEGGRVRWLARVQGHDFDLALELARTQPLLLQGDAGFSSKGPDEGQASHYYSEPQLAASAAVTVDGRTQRGVGRGWLDQEWSEELLHPDAVGWDWIGINLFDGSALTAFQLRRVASGDGSPAAPIWAGGSFRPAGGAASAFPADAVHFVAGRRWRSEATRAIYPVQWELATPAGRFGVRALLDAQELAGSGTVGAIYWEGLAELLDVAGRRVGLGYLEMTGYASRLRLG